MSTVRTNTLSNAAGSASVPVDTVISGSAKAWVNFNGTGTVAIRAAFNVSSITDNGTGDYTVNFTTALPDANYSTVCVCEGFSGGAIDNPTLQIHSSVAPTSSAVRLQSKRNAATTFVDTTQNNVTICR